MLPESTDILSRLGAHRVVSLVGAGGKTTLMFRLARELTAMGDLLLKAPADLEWRVMSSLEGDLAVAHSWRTPVAVMATLISMAAAFVLWKLRPGLS